MSLETNIPKANGQFFFNFSSSPLFLLLSLATPSVILFVGSSDSTRFLQVGVPKNLAGLPSSLSILFPPTSSHIDSWLLVIIYILVTPPSPNPTTLCTYLPKCSLNISTWISQKYVKFNMVKMELMMIILHMYAPIIIIIIHTHTL